MLFVEAVFFNIAEILLARRQERTGAQDNIVLGGVGGRILLTENKVCRSTALWDEIFRCPEDFCPLLSGMKIEVQ